MYLILNGGSSFFFESAPSKVDFRTQWVSPVTCLSSAACLVACCSLIAACIAAWSIFMLSLPSLEEWSSLRFFEDCEPESGVAGEVDAAALCINFMVSSLDETPLGGSGAIAACVM